jgi:hypothetical protein
LRGVRTNRVVALKSFRAALGGRDTPFDSPGHERQSATRVEETWPPKPHERGSLRRETAAGEF